MTMSLKELVNSLHLGKTRPYGVDITVDNNIVMWIASCNLTDDQYHGLGYTNNGVGRLLTPLRLCQAVISGDTTAASLFDVVWNTPRSELEEHIIDALMVEIINPYSGHPHHGDPCNNCKNHSKTSLFPSCHWVNKSTSKGCSNCVLEKRAETCPHRSSHRNK